LLKHIYLEGSNVAPALQSAATDLEKSIAANQLRKSITTRPVKDELFKSNILKNEGLADSLQATAQSLERQMKGDAVKKGLPNHI
jgi:hypothetical protein